MSEYLDNLMGDYDFTMPVEAYKKLCQRLAARTPHSAVSEPLDDLMRHVAEIYPIAAIVHAIDKAVPGFKGLMPKPAAAAPREPAPAAPQVIELPDSAVAAWVERHDLEGALGKGTDARAAFDDARTAHLIDAAIQNRATATGGNGNG